MRTQTTDGIHAEEAQPEDPAIQAAKEAAVKLTAAERTCRARHEALTMERQRVFHALKPQQEVIANSDALVDAHHRAWWHDKGFAVLSALSGRSEIRVAALGTSHERERVRVTPPRLPSDVNTSILNAPGALTLADLCGLVPDVLKANLRAAIEAMPSERFGLPGDARAAKLAELDAAIAEVERQHTGLVDSAAGVGITLPLLPSVMERRRTK